jgi:hypothetical protein
MNANQITPTENDTALVRELINVRNAGYGLNYALHQLFATIRYATNDAYYTGRDGDLFAMATKEKVSNAEAIVIASNLPKCADALKELAKAQAKVDAITKTIAKLEANYAAQKWSRFFLVVSSAGHIHASMGCHTCNKGRRETSFTLFPSLSGCTSEEAVARLGSALCSVCFPEAPVAHREQTKINQRAAEELMNTGNESAFDEVIAKANARAAKKLAKAGA